MLAEGRVMSLPIEFYYTDKPQNPWKVISLYLGCLLILACLAWHQSESQAQEGWDAYNRLYKRCHSSQQSPHSL